MQSGAHVTSLTALEDVRAGVCMFADEVGGALAILQSEIGRFVEWLEHDQLSYWKREIRQREERLAEAKTDLHRCLAATIDPERTPSCYQEKKLVESCKRRLEEAEQKFAAVRRWIPIVKQAVFEYTLKVEPLQSAVSADMPRAAAAIDSAIARILAYVDASPTRRPESLATEPRGAGRNPASDRSPQNRHRAHGSRNRCGWRGSCGDGRAGRIRMTLFDGKAKLTFAASKLALRWQDALGQWNDAVSRDFEERYLTPLEPKVGGALRAIDRLTEVLTRAEQECS